MENISSILAEILKMFDTEKPLVGFEPLEPDDTEVGQLSIYGRFLVVIITTLEEKSREVSTEATNFNHENREQSFDVIVKDIEQDVEFVSVRAAIEQAKKKLRKLIEDFIDKMDVSLNSDNLKLSIKGDGLLVLSPVTSSRIVDLNNVSNPRIDGFLVVCDNPECRFCKKKD